MAARDLRRGGAQITPDGVEFRVWAPLASRVDVVLEADASAIALEHEGDGWFAGRCGGLGAGVLYRFRLDGRGPYPDPYARFQPAGPHGPSMIVDPGEYRWRHPPRDGVGEADRVIYELHVGTFTREGTFDAAALELAELASLGVTIVELMPIAEFAGRFNWGYDGVDLFAPYHGYGDCHAFRRFVDAAHAVGLAVILDVVYNHLGPEGNYLPCFSRNYFTDRYENDWGEAIDFDGESSGPVRRLFIDNAAYWIDEFRLDGLRLDATQSIHDASETHVIAEVVQAARTAAGSRPILIIAENEPQDARLILPREKGGFGIDAMWNDDFHHSARVALTGRHEGYFHDHRGSARELVAAIQYGFLFQGQYYHWQQQPRGTPVLDQPPSRFVIFTQNHDQVANTFNGLRVDRLTSPGRARAITALLLLAPQTPMLFMGQEFAASAPFPFFADHDGALRAAVHTGRRDFMRQFASYATPGAQARIPDPSDERTFLEAKLDLSERERHAPVYRLHRDLLRLRREDAIIARAALASTVRERLACAVLTQHALLLRWLDADGRDRLLLVNLGAEIDLCPAPEPLLAPPRRRCWTLAWSSDDPIYDGFGAVMPCFDEGWRVSGECAVLLAAEPPSAATNPSVATG